MTSLAVAWVRFVILAGAFDIEPNTHILFELENSVSTRTAQAGDHVHLRTRIPVVTSVGVIPAGTYARGTVLASQRAGRLRGRAALEIGLTSLLLPNGTVLSVTGSTQAKPSRRALRKPPAGAPALGGVAAVGGSTLALLVYGKTESDGAAGAVFFGTLGAAVALPILLTRGDDVELARGETVEIVVEETTPLP